MGSWHERPPGSGTYQLIAARGYDSHGKKLSAKTKTIKVTEKLSDKRLKAYLDLEAERFQQEVDNGMFLDGSKLTFEEFSERWMKDYAEKQLAPKTVAGYRDYLARINQAIGHIRLEKLQPHHLNAFYDNLAENGVRRDSRYSLKPPFIKAIETDKAGIAAKSGVHHKTIGNLLSGGCTTLITAEKIAAACGFTVNKMFQTEGEQGGLNPKTVAEHHRLIHAILNKALKWQVVTANIADRAEPPKITRTEAKCYDEEQVLRLLAAIEAEPLKHKVAIYLGLFAGLRAGEMTGLEWQDVDFDGKSITISRARQHLPGMAAFDKSPKTERGRRTIQVAQTAMDVLESHRKDQIKTRLQLGNLWLDSDKVLTQWNGEPMNPQTPSKWFHKFLKAHGLPHITLHQLRHTYASLLLANDVDIASISKSLGHSKIGVTLDVYSHAIRSRDRTAADKLDDLAARGRERDDRPDKRGG